MVLTSVSAAGSRHLIERAFGALSPVPNSAGWNKTSVDLSVTTADDLSGLQPSDPANPLHFAAEGANQTQQVTVTDNAGNTATFTSPAINIDLTPPSSTAVIPGVSQDQEWFSGPVQVTPNATDNPSGVKPGSFFALDGGGPNLIFGPFFIGSAGTHTLEYGSEDRAGNVEPWKTRIINIDPAPPVTSSAVSGILGTNGWYRSAVQVSLTATDNLNAVVGSFYRIDGGVVQTYGGPFGHSTPGLHTIDYWSIDHVNIEATHTLVVRIDTGAPLVTAAANPSTAPRGPKPINVTISGSVTDAVSAISSSFNVIDEYGTMQPSGPVTVQANGRYSFTLALPANTPGNDRDGHLYTIVVQRVGQAGNFDHRDNDVPGKLKLSHRLDGSDPFDQWFPSHCSSEEIWSRRHHRETRRQLVRIGLVQHFWSVASFVAYEKWPNT